MLMRLCIDGSFGRKVMKALSAPRLQGFRLQIGKFSQVRNIAGVEHLLMTARAMKIAVKHLKSASVAWAANLETNVGEVAPIGGVVPDWIHARPIIVAVAGDASRRSGVNGRNVAVTKSIAVSVHVIQIGLFRDEITGVALKRTDSMDLGPLQEVQHFQFETTIIIFVALTTS